MSRCIWTLVDGDLLDHIIATTEQDPKALLFAMFDSLSPSGDIMGYMDNKEQGNS